MSAAPPVLSLALRAGQFLLGFMLGLPLHVVGLSAGMLLMLALGLAPNAPWPQRTQNLFLISFGLWQWLYLLPAIRLLRSRRPLVARGLLWSGGVGIVFTLLGLLAAIHGS